MILYRASRPNIETGIASNIKPQSSQSQARPQSQRGEYRRRTAAEGDQRAMQIFRMFERAANAGEPCPTNKQIAEYFGWKSISNPPVKIAMLEACKLIRVEHFNSGRIVTIVATGKSTARPANTAPHWRTRPSKEIT